MARRIVCWLGTRTATLQQAASVPDEMPLEDVQDVAADVLHAMTAEAKRRGIRWTDCGWRWSLALVETPANDECPPTPVTHGSKP